MTVRTIDGLNPSLDKSYRDFTFACGIVAILCFFFLPLPAFVIDIALAISIALSVLILMVALWIKRPLDFSSFPTILLVSTMLRLALNVATTRMILTHGAEGAHAAGYIIAGFSTLVMGNDFVIGVVVFAILVTVNFIVITKGATRIAEVGARFTLDAIPGKQMAIDADLSAGLIDEKDAQRRRKELEEESAFFGSMDGASKFVRGDAIAGLIILAVNIFGGVAVGVIRHGMPIGDAADVFTKLSVGDGLVSQIPALIVSLAAGLLVSKGGTTGPAEQAVMGQLGGYPRAMILAGLLLFSMSLVPGLPFLPFALIGGVLALFAGTIVKRNTEAKAIQVAIERKQLTEEQANDRTNVKEFLRQSELEICFGTQLSSRFNIAHDELSHRVAKMRRKFAQQFGFVVPEIRLSDNVNCSPQTYQIKIHGVTIASFPLRLGDVLVITDRDRAPDYPGEEVREPAFGMPAMWVPETFVNELRADGYRPIDVLSVVLTHLNEVIRANLAQLLSYKDMRALLNGLDPEYKKLLDDICPSSITYSGLQAVLKLLLAERISIRNLPLVLEAIAEVAPHVRRSEQVVEHVRMRMAQQICGDLATEGVLSVLRLGPRWDLAFHQALKRDAKGDIVEFDFEPRMLEQFGRELSDAVRQFVLDGASFVILSTADCRPYVRMVVERLFPNVSVLSTLEISRGIELKVLGSLS